MQLLVKHPQATYFWRVRGDSMQDAGIEDGSIIVVDRAVRPKHGCIVVALTMWGMHREVSGISAPGRMKLRAANPTYPDIIPATVRPFRSGVSWRGCVKLSATS